jgi:hypothetical protein
MGAMASWRYQPMRQQRTQSGLPLKVAQAHWRFDWSRVALRLGWDVAVPVVEVIPEPVDFLAQGDARANLGQIAEGRGGQTSFAPRNGWAPGWGGEAQIARSWTVMHKLHG